MIILFDEKISNIFSELNIYIIYLYEFFNWNYLCIFIM